MGVVRVCARERAGPRVQRALPAVRPGAARAAGVARVVPDGAVLPLRRGRAGPVVPRRHPPPAVAAAGRRGGARDEQDAARRPARPRSALPFLAPPGRRDLAARAPRRLSSSYVTAAANR